MISKKLTTKQKALARELKNEFEKLYAKDLARSVQRKKRKSNRKTKSYSKKKTFKPNKIRKSEKIIFSFISNKELKRKSLSIRLKKADQIDVGEIENRDAGILYLVLLPYLQALLKRIKKPREYFQIRLHYHDGYETGIYSTRYSDYLPTPESQENEMLDMLENIVETVEKYLNDFPFFLLTKLELVTYEGIHAKSKSNKKKRKKTTK